MPLAPSFLGTSIMLALGKLDVPTEGTTLYNGTLPSEGASHPVGKHFLSRPKAHLGQAEGTC